jgi:hypothetical protein
MILREVEGGKSKTVSFSGVRKIVQHGRKDVGLPMDFTLDACRARRHDRARRGRIDRGPGPRAIGPLDQAELGRLCQAHRASDALRYPQTARSLEQQPIRTRQVTAFRMKNLQTRKVPDAVGLNAG